MSVMLNGMLEYSFFNEALSSNLEKWLLKNLVKMRLLLSWRGKASDFNELLSFNQALRSIFQWAIKNICGSLS
jgi:hypothetical protein